MTPTADIGLNPKQIEYANTIRDVGKRMGMSERDIVTALTVALDESGIQNLANSSVPQSLAIPHDGVGKDHASVGVFQQQVGIWGNATDLMNVGNSAALFYAALKRVPNRDKMTIPQAAQTVQRSATPDGSNYAQHVDKAEQLYAALGGNPEPGVDAGWQRWTPIAVNPLQWITDPDNWKRIGLFVLGAILLGIVAWQFIKGSAPVKEGLEIAKDVIL